MKKVVLDFEAADWKACRKVVTSNIQGCCFHWTQAIWRNVQKLGLATAYADNAAVHAYIRNLMALPFLPSEHIEEAFSHLAERATPPLQPLVDYIRETWIECDVWSPETWSVYRQPVRTNNDVEGWHRRLNNKCGRGQIQFYLLVPLLHTEARLVPLQARLVMDGKLERYQRKIFKNRQGRFFKLWDEYTEGTTTTSQLLRACAHLNAPSL